MARLRSVFGHAYGKGQSRREVMDIIKRSDRMLFRRAEKIDAAIRPRDSPVEAHAHSENHFAHATPPLSQSSYASAQRSTGVPWSVRNPIFPLPQLRCGHPAAVGVPPAATLAKFESRLPAGGLVNGLYPSNADTAQKAASARLPLLGQHCSSSTRSVAAGIFRRISSERVPLRMAPSATFELLPS